jgi:endonuclease/exonuclease/phosphatase family metal-dependent hydrolase
MRAALAGLMLLSCGGSLEPESSVSTESTESPIFGWEDREAACIDRRDNDGDGYFDCDDFGCRRFAFCHSSRVRIAAFNVQSLGYTSSLGFAAVRDIVKRIDADVICLEEVEDFEGRRLARLALDAGYPHVFMGEARTAMSGGLTNACLSRYPIIEALSLNSAMISSDGRANEIARDLVEVRVELIANHRYLTAIVGHLKSGFANSDKFRRQVETMRIRDRVRALRSARPNDAVAVMGDFNEEVDGADLGWRFFSLPSGLPSSYRLGSDITLPLDYQPFETLRSAGLTLSDPTHEDTDDIYSTRIPSGRRIDFMLIDGARITADEVYEACLDDGVDDAPRGNFMRKEGSPLSCGINSTASDHRPVVVDVSIDP